MQARKGVPKRHVDRRERDSDEALGPEQAEARRQLLLEMGGQQGLAHHKRLEILDEIRDWLERRIGVGEHDAVPELARVRQHIREHQRQSSRHFTDLPDRGYERAQAFQRHPIDVVDTVPRSRAPVGEEADRAAAVQALSDDPRDVLPPGWLGAVELTFCEPRFDFRRELP